MVYHNRWDPPGHQTKTKGDQPINTTTDSQHHQECEDQEGNQPEGTRAIDEASNIRGIKKISGIKDSQDAKSSKITFNLEDGDNASTDNITMRLAQTQFRTYREHEQLGQPASNATLKWNLQQTTDAKDQRGFHQAKKDVSHTNHSGYLHRHNYVQKGVEVLYHPQKRLRGSRDNDREEAAEQAATQTNISTENTNTHTTRPDIQLMEHPSRVEFERYANRNHGKHIVVLNIQRHMPYQKN
jgi:hypothetical protein